MVTAAHGLSPECPTLACSQPLLCFTRSHFLSFCSVFFCIICLPCCFMLLINFTTLSQPALCFSSHSWLLSFPREEYKGTSSSFHIRPCHRLLLSPWLGSLWSGVQLCSIQLRLGMGSWATCSILIRFDNFRKCKRTSHNLSVFLSFSGLQVTMSFNKMWIKCDLS